MASERIGGQTLTLPEVGVRQVRDVSTTKDPSGSQSFSFTVVQSYGGQQTSMSFDVIPEGPAGSTTAGTAGSTPLAGLYLTQMKDDSGNVFSPNPAIQLMPFPAVQGATYPSPGWEQGSGTDPLSATTMSLTSGLVKSRDRVNACGVVLDSWQVEVQGTIGSAFGMGCPAGSRSCGQQKTFDLTFDAATQYGGLLIYDHLKEIGSDAVSGKPFAYDIAATIDQKPLSR
jgi:hypothetical protein